MKYNELGSFIKFLNYNYDSGNIRKISNDVINFHVKYDNPNTFNLLTFRLQQYPIYTINDEYKKLFEKLYSIGNIINSDEEKEYVEKLINTNFNDFFVKIAKEKYNELNPEFPFYAVTLPSYHGVKVSKDTIYINENNLDKRIDIFVSEIYNHLNKKLKEAGHYGSYKKLEKELGVVLFEDIRYDVNPVLCNYILDIYSRIINNSGNLKNKKLFIEICKIKQLEVMRVVSNLIILFNLYDLFDECNTYLYKILVNKKYYELYEFYNEVLYKNKNMKKIDNDIKLLLSRKENYKNEVMEDTLFNKLIHDLNFNHGLISETESFDLNIILENDNVFVNNYTDKDKNTKKNLLKKEVK